MITLIEWLFVAILSVIPTWRILRKAGYFPALSLILIVPLLGWLCTIAVMSFTQWPALKRRTTAEIASTFE